jgi:hypothetical protein
MNWKLWGSTITASLLLVVLVVLAMLIGDMASSHYLSLALLVLGACGGWLFGTLITPYDRGEKAEFATYTKALTAFVSGYVVAKVDKVLETIFTPDFLLQPLTGFRVIGFISAFIICMLITFFFRRYADA